MVQVVEEEEAIVVLLDGGFVVTGKGGAAARAFSFLECQTAWLDSEDRHLNFFMQLGRSHTNGNSPVCKRRCALRLYFFEKDLPQLAYGQLCASETEAVDLCMSEVAEDGAEDGAVDGAVAGVVGMVGD